MDMGFARASLIMMVINLVYAIVALMLGMLGLKLVDVFVLKDIDLEHEIKKGNIAAGIFAATILLFVGITVAVTLSR